MEHSRDEAFSLIGKIKAEYANKSTFLHSANEATTRLLIIDKVLSALGWDNEDFNPETHARETGYLDYLLSIDNVPRLIVEAKRTGITFGADSRNSPRNHYQLRYFRSAFGRPFSLIVTQAEKYALETGVKYALITNGCEWVLLQLLLAPGYTDLNDLRGYYFGNLFTDNFNFELFWERLHKPHVDTGSLESAFAEINIKEADFVQIPSTKFGQLEWQKKEDIVLREFYDFFFDEIIDAGRRNMLEKCFVSDSRLNQFQGELNRALKDSAPSYAPEALDIDPGDGDRLVSRSSGDRKGRVVIVTGSVGCGKSTFVTRELVRARHEQDRSLLALKIDLIDEVESQIRDIQSILWKYIDREWQNTCPDAYHNEMLRKIFGRELADLRRGPYKAVFDQDQSELGRQEAQLLEKLLNDPETYFRKCWEHYRGKGIGVVIFLDNVDRASEPYQKQVYNFTHKLARETGTTVIVTMRELTFFRGREAGFLDVRSDATVFHLRSPNLEQLLSKRIAYIEQHIEKDHRLSEWKRTRDWASFYQQILTHSHTIKRVFLVNNQGRDILALLSSVAWHNVRLFLEILKQLHALLGSSHLNWNKSEVIAALMAPLDRGRPFLGNLYLPSYHAYQNYFLKIRTILLMQYGQLQHETRHGTALSSIVRVLRQYGYQERWIRRAVQELVQQRFLECLEAPVEEEYTKNYQLGDSHSFRPSPLAHVCTDFIITDSNYLALAGNNMPFHQEYSFKKYEEIIKNFSEALMNEGLTRPAIELLNETDASNIIAKYLAEMLEDEQPSKSLAKYMPEVAGIEKRMAEIGGTLKKRANLPLLPTSTPKQRSLFDSIPPDLDETPATNPLPIPKTMSTARIGKSELAPLIFWALVYLRLQNNLGASGVEITQVINKHLVDDYNQKAPNNVSRTLRSEIIDSEEWLISRKLSARRKVFQVKQDWPEYWEEIFGEPAPEITEMTK